MSVFVGSDEESWGYSFMADTLRPSASSRRALHPLEPLAAEEIAQAVQILRTERTLGPHVRFISIALHEHPKQAVLCYQADEAFPREVEFVLLDNAAGATYEAVVSLTEGHVTQWRHVPGVQPAVTFEEILEV